MRGMNVPRIVAGGLLAGLTLNVLHAAGELLLAAEQQRMLEELGLAATGEGAMWALALLGFIAGIAAVGLYAAVQPRFAGGLGTALVIGGLVWLLLCLIPNTTLLAFGILPARFFWLASAADFVAVPLSVAAGARLYREPAAAAAPTPSTGLAARSARPAARPAAGSVLGGR